MPNRNPMRMHCPECDSIDIRMSKHMNVSEKALDLFGMPTMRCLNCQHRWRQSLWRMGEMFYARCPRCYRLELSVWEETYYKIPLRWTVLVGLGAKKVRCKPCRHNFISFRKVKGARKWVNADIKQPGDIEEPAVSVNSFSDLDRK